MNTLIFDSAKGNGMIENYPVSEGVMPPEPTRPLLDPDTPDWFVHFADTWFMSLARDVTELKESERRNNKLLRGENGAPGVVSRFELTERRVEGLFSTGSKILIAIITGAIGIMFFLVTTVMGIILYHVITTP